jgi:hypothetical protein
MKNFFQKQRELLAVVAYVGVIAGLIFLVIFPLLSKINKVNDQIQEESMKQDIAKQQLGELPKLGQQYKKLQENEGSINVLLDSNKAVTLIERLENIAQDSGDKIEISIQNSQIQKNIANMSGKAAADNALVLGLPSADYLQMQISLTGNYNSIVKFIGQLENAEYYSDIISIKIKQLASISSSGTANPFNSGSTSDPNKVVAKYNPGDIAAILDVVFYTKK